MAVFHTSVAVLCLGIFLLRASDTQGAVPTLIKEEHQLYNDLMKDYQKWARPVIKSADTVMVNFGMTLRSILEVNENGGYVSYNIWNSMMWKDVSLRWNRSDYYGIDKLRIPIDQIWSPDLAVYNSIGDVKHTAFTSMAVVTYDGNVSHIPPIITKATCRFDYTFYPYDEQFCRVRIGNRHHDRSKINVGLISVDVDTSTYIENEAWVLKVALMTRNVVKYACCQEMYNDIDAIFHIVRKSGYVTGVLVVPGVILALLIPFIFMFPPDAGEKVNLGVGIILGFILLLLVGDGINDGKMISDPPLIFRYYSVNIVLVGLSLIISMCIVQLWRDRRRVNGPPAVVSTLLVDGLGCILCIKRDNYNRTPRKVSVNAEDGDADTDRIGTDGPDPRLEWKLVAMVLDRILFLVFLAISILVAAVML